MKIEDVMGIHLLFTGILTIIYLYAGEPEWIQHLSLFLTLFIYGVYIPIIIIVALTKWLIRKNTKWNHTFIKEDVQ